LFNAELSGITPAQQFSAIAPSNILTNQISTGSIDRDPNTPATSTGVTPLYSWPYYYGYPWPAPPPGDVSSPCAILVPGNVPLQVKIFFFI
jgi:hypothetical protein